MFNSVHPDDWYMDLKEFVKWCRYQENQSSLSNAFNSRHDWFLHKYKTFEEAYSQFKKEYDEYNKD